MLRVHRLFAALLVATAALAGADARAQDATALAALEHAQPQLVQWRRDFHQHPELGEQEVRTARRVADHLRSLGLTVRTGVGKTGVVAVLKGAKPGPRIALRADMDALPVTEQTGLPFASKVKAEYRGQPATMRMSPS